MHLSFAPTIAAVMVVVTMEFVFATLATTVPVVCCRMAISTATLAVLIMALA
jgi:hypothetical protein